MLARPLRARNRRHYDAERTKTTCLYSKNLQCFKKAAKNMGIEVSAMGIAEAGHCLGYRRNETTLGSTGEGVH
jgi:hypothetical protein